MGYKKLNNLFSVLAGTLLFVFAAAAVLFLINQQKITRQQVSAPSLNQTTNWKTYTNYEYSFQLKYPDALYIDPNQETSRNIVLLNNKYKDRTNHLEQPFIQIDVTKGNLEKIIKIAQELQQQSDKKILADTKPITLSGHQGYRSNVESSDGTTLTVQIQNGDYIFGLMFVNVAKNIKPEDHEYMVETFNQILSTFKFL